MKIELERKVNWSQYVHSIKFHKPSSKLKEYHHPSLYNKPLRLKRKPSNKGLRDLSSTIDHSVMLYNQIKSNNSYTELSQRIVTKNDLTTLSTSAYPPIQERPKSKSKAKPTNYKLMYPLSITHSYSSSRNKVNVNVNFLLNNSLKAESLSQFKDKINQERMIAVVNQMSSDSLTKQYLLKKNNKELLNMQLTSRLQNEELWHSFARTYKTYFSFLMIQKEKEYKVNSDLKEKQNDLKLEIQRMKIRKSKLIQKMDSLFKMKLFLQCVKNRTVNLDYFDIEDLNEHKKDVERQKLVSNEYKKMGTITTKIKRMNTKKNYKTSISLAYTLNSSRNEREIIEYCPKVNKPIFTNENEIIFLFDNLSASFILMLERKSELKEECNILRAELNQITYHNKAYINDMMILANTINNEEAKLNHLKQKNSEFEIIKQSIMRVKGKSLPNANKKIYMLYKDIINAELPIDISIKNTERSSCINYPEVIENSLNYLLKQEVIFNNKYRELYCQFILFLRARKKEKTAIKIAKMKEDKLIERKIKILSRKNKFLKLVRRKVPVKYSKEFIKQNNTTIISTSAVDYQNEYDAMNTCLTYINS